MPAGSIGWSATAAASRSARAIGAPPEGLDPIAVAVRQMARGFGLHRTAVAELRRAAAAGIDDRAPLYRNARRRRRARPADVAGSARVLSLFRRRGRRSL